MESIVDTSKTQFSWLKTLGPGIMMATAAIGGSHLVASTKAGAIFGWQLMGLILLINLLKYPFFRAGVQYTMGTGKSLIQGYAEMGRFYLWVFYALLVFSTVVNIAAVLLFSASLLGAFLPWSISLVSLSGILLIGCLALLMLGRYKALDSVSKMIMVILSITTVLAVIIAFISESGVVNTYQGPSPWTLASLGFLVAMMGWMPAPIEISSITSLWLMSQKEEQNVTPKSALRDFNVGYIATAVLAIVFLTLGALVFYGSGVELKSSGIGYSHQLVSMYASTIGEWSTNLINLIAFMCILGTTLTVIDGYCRAIVETTSALMKEREIHRRKWVNICMLIASALAMCILIFFTSALMPMLNFAMIFSFTTTPIFALLNYLLVKKTPLTGRLEMKPWLRNLSILGLIYLFGFLFLFIWWKFFL